MAGRRNNGRLRDSAPDAEYESLIPIGGRPMGAWVVRAMHSACERLVVVGPEGLGAAALLPSPSLLDNLQRGVAAIGAVDEILVATGDAPMMTAKGLGQFLAGSRGAGLGYPIVPRAVCEAAFPGTKRTYVRADGRQYTGGNCFYLKPEAVAPLLGQLETFYLARKNPLRLARLFGFGTVLALVTGRARVATLEAIASRRLGALARAVLCDDAGIGTDCDKPSDIAVAERALAACAAASGSRP
ncbi:MAG TPA: nucleotide-diphospho-sugar transferase [Bacillota bacterium]|nr:nucleotide-diphospho-sugar transferase [Bacillota bacterium]